MENKILEEIKEILISSNKNKTSKYWLNQTKFSSIKNNKVSISVPSVFIKDSFERKFGETLKKELVLRGFSSDYRVIVDEKLSFTHTDQTKTFSSQNQVEVVGEKPLKEKEEFDLSPFENLHTGSSNNLAVVAAKTIAEKPGERFNPLFLYGKPGVGKTFLLKTLDKTREDSFYIGSEDFLNSFVQSIKNGTASDFKQRIRSWNLLLIDDIQFLAGKKAVSEEILHTINYYMENGKGIVLVSDVKPKDLFGFPERLISRVYSGLVTDIEKPDPGLLLDFLISTNKESGLNKGLIKSLSFFPFENFRELKGFLNSLSVNKEMGIDVEVYVKKFIEERERFSLSKKEPEDLLLLVSKKYQVDKNLLLSKNRTERVSNARHVLVGLLRKHTDMSLNQIGLYLGNRSHSTVLSSLKKIEKNKDLFTSIDSLGEDEDKERVG